MAQLTLVTPFFYAQTEERRHELNESLRRNVENDAIGRIILLIDDGSSPEVEGEKIEIVPIDRRPTYADWLKVTRELEIEGISILANSDIYFDETIKYFDEALVGDQKFVALSRWEVLGGQIEPHPEPQWSQDVWAIRANSEVSPQLMKRLDFELGVPRCDNKVAYVFATEGWGVKNPFFNIRSMHLHESGIRSYSKKADTRLLGGVAYVFPSDGLNKESRLHLDIWSVKQHNVVEVSFNPNLQKWLAEEELKRAALEAAKSDPNRELRRKHDILKRGKKLLSVAAEYNIFELDDDLLLACGADPTDWLVVNRSSLNQPSILLSGLLKPVISGLPKTADEKVSETDKNFWQYPCITEKQAYENHAALPVGRNVNEEKKSIALYLPLPWASFVDLKELPKDISSTVTKKIMLARDLAGRYGYSVNVHTVCQHIHWFRMTDDMVRMGVNTLHISHCEKDTAKQMRESGLPLVIKPWTLYAVNYADKSRSQGLEVGKPMGQRKLLTSFIGAHMPHYRSDIRVKMCEGLAKLNEPDVLVDLGNMWHFNKIVYNEQVANQQISAEDVDSEEDSTVRYNRILSDSKFSLCPEGAGPNTLRFWESIAIGSVPVLFDKSLQFPWSVDERLTKNCLYWNSQKEIGREFYDWLKSFSDDDLEERSRNLQKIYKDMEALTCF